MNLRKTFNQDGFVLALTLLCALILSSVMVSTMFVSTKGQKVTKNFKESVQTLNAADAAVKQAKQALASWLTATQLASGTEANFSAVLAASGLTSTAGSSGTLVIPSNATNWGNMNMFGNTVTVTIYNTEGTSSSGATDADRIIVLQADATSSTRQRVRIKANVQAPSTSNSATTAMPTFLAAISTCNAKDNSTTKITMEDGSLLSGYDYLLTALPTYTCSGGGCWSSSDYSTSATTNLPPMIIQSNKNSLVKGAVTLTGNPSTVQTMPDATSCTALFNYADQLAVLSDSLTNVDVFTGTTMSSANLGTRTNPKVIIANGKSSGSGKSSSKEKIAISANTHGSGILLVQDDMEASGTGFYFEGLIIVYGDNKSDLKLQGSDVIYGSLAVLTSGAEKIKLQNNTKVAYSARAMTQASTAVGTSLSSSTPITAATDARNTVVTVGWYEDYNF